MGDGWAPGPVGAICSGCLFGPQRGQGVYLWFCRKTYDVVSASERACVFFIPAATGGPYTEPFFPSRPIAIAAGWRIECPPF